MRGRKFSQVENGTVLRKGKGRELGSILEYCNIPQPMWKAHKEAMAVLLTDSGELEGELLPSEWEMQTPESSSSVGATET